MADPASLAGTSNHVANLMAQSNTAKAALDPKIIRTLHGLIASYRANGMPLPQAATMAMMSVQRVVALGSETTAGEVGSKLNQYWTSLDTARMFIRNLARDILRPRNWLAGGTLGALAIAAKSLATMELGVLIAEGSAGLIAAAGVLGAAMVAAGGAAGYGIGYGADKLITLGQSAYSGKTTSLGVIWYEATLAW